MARVLLTWELGRGLGHLMTLLPLAKGLRERGHRVYAALRDLSRAEEVFAGTGVSYLQAPVRGPSTSDRIDPPRTFAHILHNIGFGNSVDLRSIAEGWRNLYECVRPDLIIFDHSPTALLGARGCGARRALVGPGFFCPSDESPLPDLRPWLRPDPQRLQDDEARVLASANGVLAAWGEKPLERLSQMYQEVEENFLTTFREMDNYCRPQQVSYWGVWPSAEGKAATWPDGQGQKIYAYLKPFPTLPQLLGLLRQWATPTVIYVDGIDKAMQARFESATLRFENERLDLRQVGRECDLAILNGNHGTTVAMLLAGKPAIHIPLYLEQALNAQAVARLGAGISVSLTNPRQMEHAISAVRGSELHAVAARRFAQRYADLSPAQQMDRMIGRSEELLN